MKKIANFEFTDVRPMDQISAPFFVKTASYGQIEASEEAKKVIEAQMEKHPTALFFRAKAIEADVPNNNGDAFSADELQRSYNTFVDCPFFTNHDNQNVENAKGKVIWAEWDEKDKAIYIVAFVDREAYPNLCRGIEQEYMNGVSMGCSVEYSVCSICGNKAATIDEYCSHIRNFKGRKFTGRAKDVRTGETKNFKNAPVYEDNFGIRFIELSGVADPACTSCRIDQIFNGTCGKAASIEGREFVKAASTCFNELEVVKYASLMKEASQQDIEQLNQCLSTLEEVSVKLIQNRANVEMEFASDIVQILADLQQFTDELVQAGYGQLPGGEEQQIPGTLPEEPGAMPGPAPVPEQPVAAEEEIVGQTNVEEPLAAAPAAPTPPQAAPALEELRQTTRPAPERSRQAPKVTRPARPERTTRAEEEDTMGRRLPAKSAKDREATKRVLSGAWQEKVKNLSNKLSEILSRDPANFQNKDGGQEMAAENKKVEAKSKQADLHEITEKQLAKADAGAMPREEDDRVVITQKQLEKLRKGEYEVITEAQLEMNKGVPRQNDEREVITEKQLDPERTDDEWNVITQKQLEEDGKKTGTEQEVITEKQLSQPPTDTPWARSAATVGRHVEAAIDTLAKVTLATGATPQQVVKSAASIAGRTASEQLAFAHEIWNSEANVESIGQLAEQAKYWGSRGLTVASADKKTIREAILAYAAAETKANDLNPEFLIEALESARDNDAADMVEAKVEEIMAEAGAEEPEDVRGQMDNAFKSRREAGDKKCICGNPACKCGPECKCEKDGKCCDAYKDDEDKEAESDERKVEAESEALADALKGAAGEAKVADHILEATLDEMRFEGDVESDAFKSAVNTFASGICSAHGMKLASIVNVTVQDDTVTIAVETDNESVEIPIGGKKEVAEDEIDLEAPVEEPLPEEPAEAAPEALPEAPAAGGEDLLGLAESKKALEKKAQFGGGAPEVPNAGAGVAPPEDLANAPDAMPEEGGVQTFTEEEVSDEEELPGEQHEAGSICPKCGSNDTETGRKDQAPGQFDCNNCGLKYTYHVMVEVLNPEEGFDEDEEEIGLAAPEAPEMPVAAFFSLDRDNLAKFAVDRQEGKHICPACGSAEVEASGNGSSHKVACSNCGTESEYDVIMNVTDPSETKVRVAWSLDPKKRKCAKCKESRKAFAADLAFRKILASAAKGEFPEAGARTWIAKEYGPDAMATYGPGAGQKLADVVVEQLKTFGLGKVKHMRRLCEVQTQEDPMEACLKLHKRKGYAIAEATRLCNCLKDKYASEEDENIFIEAFAKMINVDLLRKMAQHMAERDVDEDVADESEMSISDIHIEPAAEAKPEKKKASKLELEEQEGILGKPVKGAAKTAAKGETTVKRQKDKETGVTQTVLEDVDNSKRGDAYMGHEKEAIPEAKAPEVPRGDAKIKGEKDTVPEAQEVKIPVSLELMGEEEQIDGPTNTQTLGLVMAHEDVKGKPHMSDDLGGEEGKGIGKVESIESADNVPRSDAKMGHESETIPADKAPEVPRSDAKIKGEKGTIPEAADPTVPYTSEAEKVEMRGRVAADTKYDEQKARIAAARRDKAVRIAAKMAANGDISDAEFEDMVADLSTMPLDRMEYFASKISRPAERREATLTTPIVIEDQGRIDTAKPEPTLTDKLAGAFTIGNKQADQLYRKGDLGEE